VYTNVGVSNNKFGNYVRSPIKNVNKVGLLYAAIPKTMDVLHEGNRYFDIRIRYDNQTIQVNDPNMLRGSCELPLLNYYDSEQCVVDLDVELARDPQDHSVT